MLAATIPSRYHLRAVGQQLYQGALSCKFFRDTCLQCTQGTSSQVPSETFISTAIRTVYRISLHIDAAKILHPRTVVMIVDS